MHTDLHEPVGEGEGERESGCVGSGERDRDFEPASPCVKENLKLDKKSPLFYNNLLEHGVASLSFSSYERMQSYANVPHINTKRRLCSTREHDEFRDLNPANQRHKAGLRAPEGDCAHFYCLVLLFTLLSTPRFRGRGQQMNTLYPKIIVAHYKSIGVSMSESRVSSYSGDPTITNFKNSNGIASASDA